MSRNVLTFDQLTDKVTNEFSWRRKELTILKNKIPTSKNSYQIALIRAVVPLLYAHWEGFVKSSLSYYLTYVSNQGLKHNELKTQFIALSFQSELSDIKTNSIHTKTRIIDFIFSNLNKQAKIPTKNIVNTKSNLNYEVFEDILYTLSFKDPHFESKRDLVNDLVSERNYIAHGEHKLIDIETFNEFFNDTISLMSYLKTKIENSALLKEYKKASPQQPVCQNGG